MDTLALDKDTSTVGEVSSFCGDNVCYVKKNPPLNDVFLNSDGSVLSDLLVPHMLYHECFCTPGMYRLMPFSHYVRAVIKASAKKRASSKAFAHFERENGDC